MFLADQMPTHMRTAEAMLRWMNLVGNRQKQMMGSERMIMEALLYATPLGLGIDIVGFILVVLYGHSLFMRSGTGPPHNEIGRDGDLYFQHSGLSDDRGERRRMFKAHLGVGLVVAGFCIQIVGSIAAIYLSGM